MVDLHTMKVLSTYQVGEDSDVLAYDPGLEACMSLPSQVRSQSFKAWQEPYFTRLLGDPSCTYGIGRSKDPSRLLSAGEY
jgi:hypothetical protein